MRIRLQYGLLVLLVMGVCWLRPALAKVPLNQPALNQVPLNQPTLISQNAQSLEQQGQSLFEAGQFAAAATALQQAARLYQNDGLRQAVVLSNLALVYQQLGQWKEANQAIATSLSLITAAADQTNSQYVLAQTLNIQGRLQLAQGQAEAALTNWEQAASRYQQSGNLQGELESRLNQAQALQALGLYRRAITLLTELNHSLPDPTLFKATVLRTLADALQVAGDLAQSRQILEEALQIVTAASPVSQAMLATIQLSLANLTRTEATTQLSLSALSPTQATAVLANTSTPNTLAEVALRQRQVEVAQQYVQQVEAALQLYQQAASQAVDPLTQIQAQLNQLNGLIELRRWLAAMALISSLQPQIEALPISHTSVFQRINLATAWMKLQSYQGHSQDESLNVSQDHSQDISQNALHLLATALQQATELKDIRAQSFALGSLGGLYEQTQQWPEATQATQQALMIAQSIDAADISYRWQWQLGRLSKQQGQRENAIVAYTEAVNSLQTLRKDLVTINQDVQFSFQEQVEPVYRNLVDLLLASDAASPDRLVQARQTIETLQIAELDNFFREACLEAQFQIDRVVDRANLPAAIFYTIALPDRLEVILKLPQQVLVHYTTPVSQTTVDATVDEFLAEIKRPYTSQRAQLLAQQIYDWLIRPAEARLNDLNIETLVFVLDGSLRNLPIAALSDGQQFLVEKYSLALAPGLQIADPKPLQQRRFNVLLAGLSEARANFAPLNFVAQEIQGIQAELPSKVLFNQSFTEENLQKQLDTSTFSIVHIATHGQFSSNAADTFILAWDQPINVNELSNILQTEELNSPEPIELLVLSACRTAVGDRRATLGMAGVAVRAGARSTIASLWNLDDDSGAVLMDQFYQALSKNPISKAEALRRAQQALLANPQYAAPRFWAPYILLGNWL